MDDDSKKQKASEHLLMAEVAAKSLGKLGRERADKVAQFLESGNGTYVNRVEEKRSTQSMSPELK